MSSNLVPDEPVSNESRIDQLPMLASHEARLLLLELNKQGETLIRIIQEILQNAESLNASDRAIIRTYVRQLIPQIRNIGLSTELITRPATT